MRDVGTAGVRLFDIAASLGRHPAHDVGDGSPAALVGELDHYGIAEAAVTHSLATHHDPAAGNRHLLAETADQPRLWPCWTVLPNTCGEVPDGPSLVAEARAGGVAMLNARPLAHGYDLDGPDVASLLDAMAEYGMPLIVDTTQTGWGALDAVAAAHPDLWLIVSDVGYREARRLCGLMERRSRVLLSTANLSGHLALEYMVERFGVRRVVFGTGQPVRDPGEAVVRLLWSELSDDDVLAVGGENMRRLLASSRPALEVR